MVTLVRHYGQNNAPYSDGDLNGDGSVGFDDLIILARNLGRTLSDGQLAAVSPTLGAELTTASAGAVAPLVAPVDYGGVAPATLVNLP